MRPGENANTVLAFFRTTEPQSGNGWARLAEAYLATGKPAEALAAARGAGSRAISANMTSNCCSRGSARSSRQRTMTSAIDALLFDKKTTDAYRMLPWSSPARRAALSARIAMLSRSADAEQRYQAVIGQVTTDAGLMMDRARYLRDSGYDAGRAPAVRAAA